MNDNFKRKEDKAYVISESDFNTGYENVKYKNPHLLSLIPNEDNYFNLNERDDDYFRYIEEYNNFLESEDCYD